MNKHMQGVCPNCESYDLNYEVHPILNDNYIGFEWVCNDCGTIGVEWHTMEFIAHDIVEDEED